VILPLLSGPAGLFNRNLLYTAVTRAKNCVVILGSSRTVGQMAANVRENRRYTGLKERIHEVFAVADTGDGSVFPQAVPDL
jgi:exodeoxyribonuclease V alpha subunit